MENYKLTVAELAELKKQGFELEEIEQAKQVVYSYEDWFDLNTSVRSFIPGEAGIYAHYLNKDGNSTSKGNGQLTIFVLPESESRKIRKGRKKILDGFVQIYLDALIGYFEEQYTKSLEPAILVERELQLVANLVEGKIPISLSGSVYATYGPAPWLSFRNDRRDSERIDHWYTEICVKGQDAIRYVNPGHAKQTATDLNNHHPDHLHFVVAALAFQQFKAYLSKRLPIQLTFEDWQSGNWPEWAKRLTGNYAGMHKDANGDYRHYSLSNSEYQKIAAAQKAIFEKQVDLSLQVLINDFEQRFSESRATEILLTSELQKVNQWTTDKDFGEPFNLPTPNVGRTLFFDYRKLMGKENEDANQFPYWFNELIVQGTDAHTYIEAKHEGGTKLIYPIALYVLFRYKEYLEKRSTVVAEPSVKKQRKSKKEIELPNLESALVAPGRLPALFGWLEKKQGEREWFDKNGYVGTSERNASILSGFAYGMRMARQIKPPYTDTQLYQVLCKHYNVPPTNELRKAKGHNYDEVKGWVMKFFGVE